MDLVDCCYLGVDFEFWLFWWVFGYFIVFLGFYLLFRFAVVFDIVLIGKIIKFN